MRQRDVVMHISMLNVQHHFGFESQKVWLKKNKTNLFLLESSPPPDDDKAI